MTFHCLIVGSRGYTDYGAFKAKCDALLADKTDIEIVSGGCSGADALAERYAHSHGYPLQIFPAEWSRYGKRAGYVRNRRCMPTSRPLPSAASLPFGTVRAKAPPKVSPSRKSLTTLLGLSGLTLATAFMAHDFIGTYYRQTVISNES